LSVAWCGDTQFCLVKNGKIDFLSLSHSPENEDERKRIEKSGGSVSNVSNVWRLNGSLGVARSFGDVDYQAYGLTSDPDFKSLVLDGSEDYFIIGCDGLWDSIDLEKLCESIYEQRNNVENMAEYLVKLAKENGSSDNISAIFVLLKDDFNQISKPEKL
jgi:serine/threonine protein phosphatase PrpC